MNHAKNEVITINAQHPIVIKGFMEICFCEDNMRSLYKTYLRMGICLNLRRRMSYLIHLRLFRGELDILIHQIFENPSRLDRYRNDSKDFY